MNPNKKLKNEHIDIGTIVNIKELKKVETRVLFILYIIEDKFSIDELTNKQIHELINSKLRLTTNLSSVNMAIKRSKGKISTIRRDGIAYHKIMALGIGDIMEILLEPPEKEILDLVIPKIVVESEKGYFKNVIKQVNGCYQDGYYDACFVMIRRSIETLVIDVFESLHEESQIKNSDGNFLAFSKLIDKTLANDNIKLSKIAKADLKIIKKFGDTAAHNRRLNLKKCDIDKYSDSIRLIIEELINNK